MLLPLLLAIAAAAPPKIQTGTRCVLSAPLTVKGAKKKSVKLTAGAAVEVLSVTKGNAKLAEGTIATSKLAKVCKPPAAEPEPAAAPAPAPEPPPAPAAAPDPEKAAPAPAPPVAPETPP